MSTRMLPFPQNLTPGQVRCIEALRIHGGFAAAAKSLGIAHGTLKGAVTKARVRAGVSCTDELVRRYYAAKGAAE